MRDRFFHIFREFIKLKVVNEMITTVDRWKDPKYEEIRYLLEDSITNQKDINIHNNTDFFHMTSAKNVMLAGLASSTGASPLALNSDQTKDTNEILKSNTQPNNKK